MIFQILSKILKSILFLRVYETIKKHARFSIFFLIFFLCPITLSFAQQGISAQKLGVYDCGRQPKQVLFSPEGHSIILPLLDDCGFQVFNLKTNTIEKLIQPPKSQQHGFAEGLFLPQKNTFLVSQMTTDTIYEYSWPDLHLKRQIATKGTWSKFIAYSPDSDTLAVSNWISNDVSIIDYRTGIVQKLIKTGAAPRGLLFINQGKSLIVLSFEGGMIQQFNTKNGVEEKCLKVSKSAMRHIVANTEQTRAYISDMYHSCIYELDIAAFKIIKTYKTFSNPNTISLLDSRFLFVSCRGPNNTQDYTKRSPQNGQVEIFDLIEQKKILTLPGGNQPTGLDISPDGTLLCFSNFQDATIELYAIKSLIQEPQNRDP